MKNGFKTGKGGVYTCSHCGHKTRDTGKGNAQLDCMCCPLCEKAMGIYNQYQSGVITEKECEKRVKALYGDDAERAKKAWENI